ncbi:MAG: LysR family transcriptional regulator [Sphingomonadales bacterium]|nr:MAG: LysR family transcriptional regulator [Sphingomonadales bacterium]
MLDILTANVRKLDIGTLVALQKLLTERNLSRVAREMGLSQPAMSHTLARLRRIFDDPLLVRDGGGLALTAQGEALRLRLDSALPAMVDLFREGEFDPERSSAVFKLAITDHAGQVLLPDIATALRERAPHMRLIVAVIPNRQTDLADLDAGQYDLRIGWLRSLPGAWHRRKLLDDRIVVIGAKDHPDLEGKLTLERFIELDHIGLESERPIYPNLIDSYLATKGLERHVAMRISHFSIVPTIVARTRMVAMFPERLAKTFHGAIKIVDSPIDFPSHDLSLAWHPRIHTSRESIWLRSLIVECARAHRGD